MQKKWIYMPAIVMLLMSRATLADRSGLVISLPTKVEAGRIDPIVVPAHAVVHGQPIQVDEAFCVYSNATNNGDYQVTLTGSGAENAFELSNGKYSFPYKVAYNDEDQATGYIQAKANEALGDQMAGSIQHYPCHIDNARIRLRIDSENYERLPAGTYTGTLFITVGED